MLVYEDWPLVGVKDPHSDNDVLFGRGGKTNHHMGNIRYRSWVDNKYRPLYEKCRTKTEKTMLAMKLIKDWRLNQPQGPPGRFLTFNESDGTWEDVGDRRAREKISQALRESISLHQKGGRPGHKKVLNESEPKEASSEARERARPVSSSRSAKRSREGERGESPINEDIEDANHKRYPKKEMLDRARNLFLLSTVASVEGNEDEGTSEAVVPRETGERSEPSYLNYVKPVSAPEDSVETSFPHNFLSYLNEVRRPAPTITPEIDSVLLLRALGALNPGALSQLLEVPSPPRPVYGTLQDHPFFTLQSGAWRNNENAVNFQERELIDRVNCARRSELERTNLPTSASRGHPFVFWSRD
jgi:hypothetical protein